MTTTGGKLAETLKLGTTRDPLLGRVLGAYRIQERVGEGTGLPSYLAEHVHLDRQVLFKLFHPPRGPDEAEAIRSAIQHARELSALKHEGVLPLVEIAECGDGFMYVVLELSGARPLPAVLAERGPMKWPAARALGRQIAAALLAAEAGGLVGSEPAASQIFITPAGPGEPRARVDLVTPESLGWVPARAPDLARGVGRLLYAMLAGHEVRAAEDQPLPDLVLGSPEHDIPSDADALVMRAVDPDRSRRWSDLATLHRELGGRDETAAKPSQARAEAPTTPVLDADDEAGDVSFGRRLLARPSRPALIAGAVGVLAAIIVALAIVSGPSEGDGAARTTAEKFKVTTTVPPPQPMVLPPPPVPAPEPEPPGADAAVPLDDAGAAVASLEPGAIAPAHPAGAQPAASAAPGTPTSATAPAAASPPAGVGGPAGPAAPVGSAAAAVTGTPGAAAAVTNAAAASPAGAPRAAVPGATAQRSAPGSALPAAAASPPPGSPSPAAPETAGTLASTTPASPPAGPAAAPASARAAGPAPVARPAAAAPAEAKQGTGSSCTLSLGSIPWSDVQVDGQRAGFTPITDLPVPCGTHEILFTSAERGLERRITLSVRPGEKVKRIVDLGGPKANAAGPVGAGPPSRPPCRVTLGSKPWSEIWIDGNRAGTTPLVDYPVSCGTHDVLFLSRDSNVQHRESLTVQSTLKRVITLVESTD